MFKKIKPKLIAISIIALIIAGAVNYVYYLTRPLSIIKNPNIPNEFTYNNEKIALAWTDDNEGETLIIKSDKKEYSGFNQTDVYFSVTNISNKDQDADIILWFKDEKGSAKGVERLSDAQNFKFQITNVKSNPNDKIQNNQNAGASGNGYAVNDKIASGETNYYKATIKFPPMSKGEFNIEAVGTPAGGKALRAFRGLIEPKIAYGLLDPWYSSSWSYRRAITQINSPQTNLLKGGLVGYWSFNGQDMNWASTTAEALDRSGNGNNGNVINNSKPISGISGQAMQFDGTGDKVVLPQYFNYLSGMSVSVWFNSSDTDSAGGVMFHSASGTNRLSIAVENGILRGGITGSVKSCTCSNGVWHHAVFTTHGSDSSLLLDGNSCAGSDSPRNYSGTFIASDRIGDNQTDYKGLIDEVRVYNRALSADEAAQLYRAGARKIKY